MITLSWTCILKYGTKKNILCYLYISSTKFKYTKQKDLRSHGGQKILQKNRTLQKIIGDFFWKFALVNIVKGTKWNIFEIFNKTVCIMHYIAMDKTYWTSIYVMLSSKSKKNRYVPDKFMFITKK